MVGTVILFVLGLLIMAAAIPVCAVGLATLVGLIFGDPEYAPIGFLIGWIVGLVIAAGGAVLAILQVISFVQQVTS